MPDDHVRDRAPQRRGRKKLWHENVNLTLSKGSKARMDAALMDGEDRLDLIRAAIDAELRRRKALVATVNGAKIGITPTWAWGGYGISSSGTAVEWRLPMQIQAAADVQRVASVLNPTACPPTSSSLVQVKSGPPSKKKRRSPRTGDPRYNRWTKTKSEGRVAAWDDYGTFLRDIGERPDGMMFLRRDASAPHGPENFYWGSVGDRNYTSDRCNKVLYDGQEWTIPELGAKYNINDKTLRIRLRKMPIDEALHREVRWGPGRPKYK